MWAENNLNNFGMFLAVAWTAFNLLNVYEFAFGIAPADAANLTPFGIQVAITALFFFLQQKVLTKPKGVFMEHMSNTQ